MAAILLVFFMDGELMAVPKKPSLNGRILAEFYLSTETAKRSTLRAYAKPPNEQTARIQMYDPIRRIIPDYFKSGRDNAVLDKVTVQLNEQHFDNPIFDEKWHKANRVAIKNLLGFTLNGSFDNITSTKYAVSIGKFEVRSTVSFYADFIPTSARGKTKRVGVIVNPSGITMKTEERRKLWASIECEVAFRTAATNNLHVEEIMYLDLVKNELRSHKGPKKHIWSEIEATCERIFRDWRDFRTEMQQAEEEAA